MVSRSSVGRGRLRRRQRRRRGGRHQSGAAGSLAEAGDDVLTGVERRLLADEVRELGLEGLLVEKLAAGQAVDLGPQGRDPVLVGLLLPGGAGERGGEKVVAEDEVAGRQDVEAGEDDAGEGERGGDPRPDGESANIVAAGDDDPVGGLTAGGAQALTSSRHTHSPVRL